MSLQNSRNMQHPRFPSGLIKDPIEELGKLLEIVDPLLTFLDSASSRKMPYYLSVVMHYSLGQFNFRHYIVMA